MQMLCRCRTSKAHVNGRSQSAPTSNVEMKCVQERNAELEVDEQVTWNIVITALDRVLFVVAYLAVFTAIGTLFPHY